MPYRVKEEKIVAISLFLASLISNGIGAIISVFYIFKGRFYPMNFFSTFGSLLIITLIFIFCWRRKKYILYSRLLVLITTYISFPAILLSSPDAIFFPYIGILGSAYGFLNFKSSKFAKVGVVSFIYLMIVFFIKAIYRINISTDYVPNNIPHLIGGLSASYLFSLVITAKVSINYYKLLEKTQMNAIMDALTGAYNRYYLNSLNLENSCLMMLDIDHFKRLNDDYGHLNGDESLKLLVELLKQNISKDSYVVRYGGEEFIVVLKNVDLEAAKKIANFLRIVVMTQTNINKTIKKGFTISAGVIEYDASISLEQNIKLVDSYLYNAKNNGRNQIFSI